MQDKLLAEFPDVSYEAWRAQVDKDLKGAAFEKRLVTRTLEGLTVQPLYTADNAPDPGGFSGMPDYRRGGAPLGSYGRQWDLRAEQRTRGLDQAKREIAEDLAGGARSLWLRFDAAVRCAGTAADGLACADARELQALLDGVDLSQVPVALDAGGNVALAACYLAIAPQPAAGGMLGCDPLGAWARDSVLPFELERSAALTGELMRACLPLQLRAAQVSTEPHHAAGAHGVQELGYALATGVTYLRWGLAAGLTVDQAAGQIGFAVAVGSDLFLEIAKLRALRLCWAKVIAAHGGGADGQNTHVHAVTSPRTKTRRDPWVNMLRGTTEAFAAMVGGADSLTTRGFDAELGASDGFARRIARNVQNILNEEAHVTRVADAAGGSYYVEKLTDELARAGWASFQDVERRGGMSEALRSGAIAREIAETHGARARAVAKRSAPITGVSEYANLGEQPVQRASAAASARAAEASQPSAAPLLAQLKAANAGERVLAAVTAARAGASLRELTLALAGTHPAAQIEPLPVRRSAEPYEVLRSRAERAATPPRAFLCNLGEIPRHKARASFAAGFLNAGGIAALDNDGFSTPELALEAFASSGTQTVVVCGSDDQYPEWLPALVPALRERGATQVVVAGRPGEHQAGWEQAGVTHFIFIGVDVVATLGQLLDGMGVAP